MKPPFYVCLSHDVDHVYKTFQFITHFLKNLLNRRLPQAWYHLRSMGLRKHYWCFDSIMALEESFGVKSTFYFLNETYPVRVYEPTSWRLGLGYYNLFAKHVQQVIRKLDTQGWEVGLHGSYRSFNDINLLKKEKEDLESIVGHPIEGIRQHYLNCNGMTWKFQHKVGFSYDASFGFTNDIGFKDNLFHGFKPFPDRDFYVIPLALMDSCLMKIKDPLSIAYSLIKEAQKHKGCLVLNWHQRMFNEMEFPGFKQIYCNIIKECRRRNALFLTLREYISQILK